MKETIHACISMWSFQMFIWSTCSTVYYFVESKNKSTRLNNVHYQKYLQPYFCVTMLFGMRMRKMALPGKYEYLLAIGQTAEYVTVF